MRNVIDDAVAGRPQLENAPLKAVICQVQFPRQLGLGDDEVRPIQRALSHRYPLLAEEQAMEVVVEDGSSPKGFTSTGGRQRIFRFRDTPETWTATVSPGTISLETTEYVGMKDLLVRWSELVSAAAEALELTAQTRLGLRYINELDCPDPRREDLSGWVREELVILLRSQPGAKHLRRFISQAQFRQPDGSSCNMRHGLATSDANEDRTVFLLDLDCFRGEAVKFDPVAQIRNLASLNECAYDYFHWAFHSRALESFDAKRSSRQALGDVFIPLFDLDDATIPPGRGELGRGFLTQFKSGKPDAILVESDDADDLAGLPESLSEILSSIRESIDIPVADLARMVGLRRRHFYNLLAGGSTSTETEIRIRRLAAAIRRLTAATGGGPQAMRDAVLTPIGPDGTSFFEVAAAGDDERLAVTVDALLVRSETRGLRRTRRAIPRPVPNVAAEQRRQLMREALADLPPDQPKRKRGGR